MIQALPMSHQVLARKWRPRDFESLVGQQHVVQALSHALNERRLHHAYLLTGTRGVGKTTIARILAKSLNCETGPTARPCLRCAACQGIDEGRFVDYIEMDAASNRGVDEMTQLLENAVYVPNVGRYKVYVIDEVHMLSTHAFNAMLKTLEEPPPHVVFVLATTDPQRVPVTVLSRCLQFNLKNMSPGAVAGHLVKVLEAESIDFERSALSLLGRAAAGSMRDALSLLDQAIAFGGGAVAERTVREMLGAVDHESLVGLVEDLLAGDGAALMARADRLREDNVSFSRVCDELALIFHQLALLKAGLRVEDEASESADRLAACAAALSAEQIQVWYQTVIHGARDLPLAPDEYSGFSMTLLRLFAFRPLMEGDAPPPAAAPRRSERATDTLPVGRSGASRAERGGAPPPDGTATVRPVSAAPQPSVSTTALVGAVQAGGMPTPAQRQFEGDWPALARSLPLAGFARQFMDQSELLSVEGDLFHVRVPIKPLAESPTVTKVTDALARHLGRPIRLKVEVGAVGGVTAAGLAEQDRSERLSKARSAIEADPFVRKLVQDFGGSIVPDSVVPLADGGAPGSR